MESTALKQKRVETLDELRELEAKHRDTVVVIGVHSPKFAHEAEHGAVVDAVERYGVEHPVLDDPELATWKQYAVRAWPTLAILAFIADAKAPILS